MASGTRSDDLFILTRFARDVYRKSLDFTGEYRQLAREIRQLANTLEELEDVVQSGRLETSQEAALREHSQVCKEVLWDLNALLEKYNSLPPQSKTSEITLDWNHSGVGDIRTRLTSTLATLSTFCDSATQSLQTRIEQALHRLITNIQGGQRDGTSIVALATAVEGDRDLAWPEIVKALEGLGISESTANENRTFIADWVARAVNEALSQVCPPDTKPMIQERNEEQPLVSVQAGANPASSSASSTAYTPRPAPTSAIAVQGQLVEPRTDGTELHASRRPIDSIPSQEDSESLSADQHAARAPSFRSMDQQEDSNILWTAQRIVIHWNERDWIRAEGYLQQQAEAVQAGETIMINNIRNQPDPRVLRHLLGVCASFQGDYIKAKSTFESVLRGPYVDGMGLDQGDISAARWLGETCLHLNEPRNAALAWAVALSGLTHHGAVDSQAYRFLVDLRYLEDRARGLFALKDSFTRFNIDGSSIFLNTANANKSRLINETLQLLRSYTVPPYGGHQPYKVMGIGIAEGFLVQPLISPSSWPLPYDPFFQPVDVITFLNDMNRPISRFNSLVIHPVGLGQTKSLDYVTKKDHQWLVRTICAALKAHQIEYKELTDRILCRIFQVHSRIASYNAYGIKIRKLPFRSAYGFKVTQSLYKAREIGGDKQGYQQNMQDIVKRTLADRLKEYLEQVERYPNGPPPEPPPYPQGVMELTETGLIELPLRPSPLAYPKGVAELTETGIAELPGSNR